MIAFFSGRPVTVRELVAAAADGGPLTLRVPLRDDPAKIKRKPGLRNVVN